VFKARPSLSPGLATRERVHERRHRLHRVAQDRVLLIRSGSRRASNLSTSLTFATCEIDAIVPDQLGNRFQEEELERVQEPMPTTKKFVQQTMHGIT
jgi:hypothetical protein